MDNRIAVSIIADYFRKSPLAKAVTGKGRFPFKVIALFVFMGISCAKQGYPPGGGEDKTAPYLEGSTPAALAVSVPRIEPVILEFSEPMDVSSVEDNMFIVPIPSSWPSFEWKSKDSELRLHFSEPLLENTTYVFSIGTKASDLRRNELEESIMLSFSTGEKIENGKIRGKIIPATFEGDDIESVSGVDVAAFRVNGDTNAPDPRDDIPDYVTQSGADGSYEMIGLSSGHYRLFAIGDKDKNGFYSEGYDMIGTASHDVALAEGDSAAYAPDITIAERDTSGVNLVSISVPDSRRVELYFDRHIDPSTVSVSFDELEILNWIVPDASPQMISAFTAEQENGRRYTVKSIDFRDYDGNAYKPMEIVPYFDGKDTPDTTALEISDWGPAILQPGNDIVRVAFNRILELPGNLDAIFGEESAEVMTAKRVAPNALEFHPIEPWRENTRHRVTFDREKLTGAAGNRLTEDGSVIDFRIVSADTLGFIEGSIEDETVGTNDAGYRLILKHIESGDVKTFDLESKGPWETGAVLPGRYLMRAYRDDDGDGSYSRGAVIPFRPSEQIFAFPDTLAIVSRWTNGDNVIIFK